MSVFGLRNYKGSCWVNACLQGIFRLPEVQRRYSLREADKNNVIDASLQTIWASQGDDGLKELFDAVRTETMPAGHGIGDSHELLQYLCDKVPFLDKLFRFKIANTVECSHCHKKEVREDSVIEFSFSSFEKHVPISKCIQETVTPHTIEDWTCETCSQKGCTKQQLIGSFPKAMVFHMVSPEGTVDYSSVLMVNGRKYVLSSSICYSGFHWWTRGRNMPPGSSWYTFDDQTVTDHGAKQFPLSNMMRILIYYRLED
jgi:ubiquitin C-terminal hydrolase